MKMSLMLVKHDAPVVGVVLLNVVAVVEVAIPGRVFVPRPR